MGLMEYSLGKVYMNAGNGIIDWAALNKDALQCIADVGNENVVMDEEFDAGVLQ